MSDVLISLESIKKTYVLGEQIVDALKGVDLKILKGEYIALMGPSGSGKSTLMNIIGCLDTPSSGNYWLNGKEVSQMSDAHLSEVRNTEIGFVFQTFNLLNRLNAIDNVALPLVYAGVPQNVRIERAKIVLEKVGLKDRMNHKPNELSGGQRQRVAVARALINNPSLLLADEPTGNLDPETSEEIMHLLIAIAKEEKTAILMATHDMQMVQKFPGRIIKVEDGGIKELT